MALLTSFIIGAIVSTYLIQFYILKTIWIVAVILFAFIVFRISQYVGFKKAMSLKKEK